MNLLGHLMVGRVHKGSIALLCPLKVNLSGETSLASYSPFCIDSIISVCL